jgi:hypothetical protein
LIAALGLASAAGCSGSSLPGPAVNYTFDVGTEGWFLSSNGGSFTNLGVIVPDGGSAATLGFVRSDGDPHQGALSMTVAFTAPSQFAAAEVTFGQAGRDLSGKTLHAQIRLVSGSAAGAWTGLYACSVSSNRGVYGYYWFCAYASGLDAAALAAGAWVPLVMDLDAAAETRPSYTSADFSPAAIIDLGIWVYTPTTSADGGTADGGAFVGTGELVFEIDTVTD